MSLSTETCDESRETVFSEVYSDEKVFEVATEFALHSVMAQTLESNHPAKPTAVLRKIK